MKVDDGDGAHFIVERIVGQFASAQPRGHDCLLDVGCRYCRPHHICSVLSSECEEMAERRLCASIRKYAHTYASQEGGLSPVSLSLTGMQPRLTQNAVNVLYLFQPHMKYERLPGQERMPTDEPRSRSAKGAIFLRPRRRPRRPRVSSNEGQANCLWGCLRGRTTMQGGEAGEPLQHRHSVLSARRPEKPRTYVDCPVARL